MSELLYIYFVFCAGNSTSCKKKINNNNNNNNNNYKRFLYWWTITCPGSDLMRCWAPMLFSVKPAVCCCVYFKQPRVDKVRVQLGTIGPISLRPVLIRPVLTVSALTWFIRHTMYLLLKFFQFHKKIVFIKRKVVIIQA